MHGFKSCTFSPSTRLSRKRLFYECPTMSAFSLKSAIIMPTTTPKMPDDLNPTHKYHPAGRHMMLRDIVHPHTPNAVDVTFISIP